MVTSWDTSERLFLKALKIASFLSSLCAERKDTGDSECTATRLKTELSVFPKDHHRVSSHPLVQAVGESPQRPAVLSSPRLQCLCTPLQYRGGGHSWDELDSVGLPDEEICYTITDISVRSNWKLRCNISGIRK